MSHPENQTRIELEGGKYTVCHTNGTNFHALRHGAQWRDLTGDGLVLAMAQEIEDLRDQVELLRPDANRWEKLRAAGPNAAGWLAMTQDSEHWDEAVDQHLVTHTEPTNCTNDDSWNCKYCRKTETCEALKDEGDFSTRPVAQPVAHVVGAGYSGIDTANPKTEWMEIGVLSMQLPGLVPLGAKLYLETPIAQTAQGDDQ